MECNVCGGEVVRGPDGVCRCRGCHAAVEAEKPERGADSVNQLKRHANPLNLYDQLVPDAPCISELGLKPDPINHPKHYTSHPSGIECIQITEHMGFCLGNAVKYIWRADLKADAIEDLKKARWYIDRELARRGA